MLLLFSVLGPPLYRAAAIAAWRASAGPEYVGGATRNFGVMNGYLDGPEKSSTLMANARRKYGHSYFVDDV